MKREKGELGEDSKCDGIVTIVSKDYVEDIRKVGST